MNRPTKTDQIYKISLALPKLWEENRVPGLLIKILQKGG
jgi:hypothetical protein